MLPQHRDEPLVGRVAVCLEQLIYLRFTLMSAHLTKSAVVTPTLALVCLSVLSAAISAEPLYIQPDQDDMTAWLTMDTRAYGASAPGLSIALHHSDQSLALAEGITSPDSGRLLSTRDGFHVGSVTKTFTAALIMQLAQSGELSLDEPIERWVQFPQDNLLTIRMLLAHTSGLKGFDESDEFNNSLSPEASMRIASSLPPLFAPGEDWAYSNTNYLLLGIIAERVAGRSWEDQIQSRFIRPLGLTQTYIWTGHFERSTVSGLSLRCIGKPAKPAGSACLASGQVEPRTVKNGRDWQVAWAAGGMVSTPTDLVIWFNALMTGKVVDHHHLQLMKTGTPQAARALKSFKPRGKTRLAGYGLGLFLIDVDGVGVLWGHPGLINGFAAEVAFFDRTSSTFALTTNYEFADTYKLLGELVAKVIVPKPASRPASTAIKPH